MSAEEQEKTDAPPAPAKKRGIMAVVLVTVGAALGGAGVVLFVPRPDPASHGAPAPDIRLFDYQETMEFTFNPIVEHGTKQARVEFLFTYKADAKDVGIGIESAEPASGDKRELPPVLQAIRINWTRAYSRCLEVLSNQTAETLLDPDGKRRVKRLLIDELSATLFPDGIATVDDILWKAYFVQ